MVEFPHCCRCRKSFSAKPEFTKDGQKFDTKQESYVTYHVFLENIDKYVDYNYCYPCNILANESGN
jgi:hypothetical protein